MQIKSVGLIIALCGLMTACASDGAHAPVEERGGVSSGVPLKPVVKVSSVEAAGDWRPQMVVVQKGDTLYGIAFNYGLDYRELAELNGIENPSLIQIGQSIRLFPAENKPIVQSVPVEVKPLVDAPLTTPVSGEPVLKVQPKVVKLPYSEQALTQVAQAQSHAAVSTPAVPSVAVVPAAPLPAIALPMAAETKIVAKTEPKPVAMQDATATLVVKKSEVLSGDDEAVEWTMPTSGKLIGEFSESANRKGIDLAGKIGQPVNASAAGKVVYSGSGLRGYGKLIIIKHNKTYLSAYAHNDRVLVKEGQAVEKGQKIAEMGNSDADQPKLHFEIRRYGKPVDPAKFLALSKP